MNNDTLKTYDYLWTQRDKYCLGPPSEIVKILDKWENEYGVYKIQVFYYMPWSVGKTHSIREQIIAKMEDSGCTIITQDDINNSNDHTRLWDDSKDEFVIKRRKDFNGKPDEYDVIYHLPLNQEAPLTISKSDARYQVLVQKMIDVGVEIIKEDEFVLKQRQSSEDDYEIIYQYSNQVVFADVTGAKRAEMIQKLLDGGVKIID